MRRLAALAAALAGLAGPAAADVVSAAPQAVEVTVYREGPVRTADLARGGGGGLAMISETRTVTLPAGRTRIRFEGVADGVLPQSAAIEGLPGAVVERNYDYDLLSPGSLIAALVGQPVRLVRTNPKTGQQTSESAVLRAGPDGVVVQTKAGVEALKCGGEPERLVFDHAPANLADRPTLSVTANLRRPGRYQLRLSYLSLRLNWSADYVARVAADGASLDLSGWITLANHTGVSFEDARTAVVAGRLARVPVNLPAVVARIVQQDCWPSETTHSGWPEPPPPPPPPMMAMMAPRAAMAMPAPPPVMVTAAKRVQQSELGDYKLYSLAEPTTVAARQTKQVQFLSQPGVRFELVYSHQVNAWPGYRPAPDRQLPATAVLRLDNTKANGLGEPLPAGQVSVRQADAAAGGRELLIGEYGVRDVPVGEPFEIPVGQAADVFVEEQVVSDTLVGEAGHRREEMTLAVTAFNRKSGPALVEIRHAGGFMQGFKVTAESAPHGQKGGDPVWRLPLPAGGDSELRYSVSFDR